MAIQLTYKQFRELNNHRDLIRKLNLTPLPIRATYSLKKILEFLSKKGVEIHEQEYEPLIQGFQRLDENGQKIPLPSGDGFELKEGCEGEYMQAILALDKKQFVIDQTALSMELLKKSEQLQLSISELTALEPLCIEHLEEGAEVPSLKIS